MSKCPKLAINTDRVIIKLSTVVQNLGISFIFTPQPNLHLNLTIAISMTSFELNFSLF